MESEARTLNQKGLEAITLKCQAFFITLLKKHHSYDYPGLQSDNSLSIFMLPTKNEAIHSENEKDGSSQEGQASLRWTDPFQLFYLL